jgi:hypothetical protein
VLACLACTALTARALDPLPGRSRDITSFARPGPALVAAPGRRSPGAAGRARPQKKATHAGGPLTRPVLVPYIHGMYVQGKSHEGRPPDAVGGASLRERSARATTLTRRFSRPATSSSSTSVIRASQNAWPRAFKPTSGLALILPSAARGSASRAKHGRAPGRGRGLRLACGPRQSRSTPHQLPSRRHCRQSVIP